MDRIDFNASPEPTLGVEIELALVDKNTGELTSACPELIANLPELERGAIKPELMQCYIELNTDVCHTVSEAADQLANNLTALESVADPRRRATLVGDSSLFVLARSGCDRRQTLSWSRRVIAGHGALVGHFRAARPCRRRLGRQSGHDLRPSASSSSHIIGRQL